MSYLWRLQSSLRQLLLNRQTAFERFERIARLHVTSRISVLGPLGWSTARKVSHFEGWLSGLGRVFDGLKVIHMGRGQHRIDGKDPREHNNDHQKRNPVWNRALLDDGRRGGFGCRGNRDGAGVRQGLSGCRAYVAHAFYRNRTTCRPLRLCFIPQHFRGHLNGMLTGLECFMPAKEMDLG